MRATLSIVTVLCLGAVGCGEEEPPDPDATERLMRALAEARATPAPAPPCGPPAVEEGWIAGDAALPPRGPAAPSGARLCGGYDADGARQLVFVSAGTREETYAAWERAMLERGMTLEPWDPEAADLAFDFGDETVQGYLSVDAEGVTRVRWQVGGAAAE